MANTYASLHYHVIFSTKNRINWIKPDLESRIWRFIGGIAREHKMTALQIGGCNDHVHALVQAPPIYSPSEIAQYLKGQSSKWIHEELRALHDFGWQDGYGAFTAFVPALKGRPKITPSLRDDDPDTALFPYLSNAFRSHLARLAPAS